MDQTQDKTCPHCGSEMTSVFKNKRITYVCEKCDADPLKSQKIGALLGAGYLRQPE